MISFTRFGSMLMVLALCAQANAINIRVSQESAPGADDFDANILGQVTTYNTGLTAENFYQYNNPNGASYNGENNGGPTPISQLTQAFVVNASDGLSLFVVHDNPNDGSGGVAANQWDLSGDTAGPVLNDDVDDTITVGGGGTTFQTDHAWLNCCTDGYVIGSLDGDWELLGQFLTTPTNIDGWQVTSSNGNHAALDLQTGRRVRLDPVVNINAIPEPLTTSLGLIGVAMLSASLRRRRAA